MEAIYEGVINKNVQEKITNLVKRKTDEIIKLREKFDKRFGLYKPDMYTVTIIRKGDKK